MSDEPKRRMKLSMVPAMLFGIAMLVAYEGAHRATATFVCTPTCGYFTHQIGGKELPPWANDFFGLAERFDELIGVSAWKSP